MICHCFTGYLESRVMSKNKRLNPYKEANEAFLREKAQEELPQSLI